MILRFRVANHRSIREPAELSFVRSSASAGRAAQVDWPSVTLPAIGLYGPNASGKSTVLEAIDFLSSALRQSATSWVDQKEFPRHPFLLDDRSVHEPSEYEIDLVVQGVRYNYGFVVGPTGIDREWLYSYPVGHRRALFERSGSEFSFRRGLGEESQAISRLTKSHVLFLSMAGLHDHTVFQPIHHRLAHHIGFARFSESDQRGRIRMVKQALEDPQVAGRVESLLREADLGVAGLAFEEQEPDEKVRQMIERILAAVAAVDKQARPVDTEKFLNEIKWRLQVVHTSEGGPKRLPLEMESSGTIALLALAVPALRALAFGDLLLIDEIDSSLHPRLTAALIDIFIDAWPGRCAQVLFTSHDTSLLGPLSPARLTRDSIWFTEKKHDGATELYALSEFSPRATHNVERRYLQGRYGAVPVIPERLTVPGDTRGTDGTPDEG